MEGNKFIYQNQEEFELSDCQCELCLYYNNGKRSSVCPMDLIEDIVKGEIFCPKLLNKNLIESKLFTKEEAIILYRDRFDKFPENLMSNCSDEIIINKIVEAVKSGKEIVS